MREVHVSEVIYTHEYLWRAAQSLHKHPVVDEKIYYYRLASLMMTHLAFEAFVNFLGEVVCPQKWAIEKETFRGRGDTIEAKISDIVLRLPGYEWRKGERPYQDIKKLKRFRDLVAHGRVVRGEYVTIAKEDEVDFRWSHEWDEFTEPAVIASSMASVKTFCQSLIIAARMHFDEPHLLFGAFEGPLASAEGTSRPK
jgi:hypothetical protein